MYDVYDEYKNVLTASHTIFHVQVKWRANLRAIGFLEIEVNGKKKLVDIGEVLPNHQRILYALGTLNFGDRQKITAITTLHNGSACISLESL